MPDESNRPANDPPSKQLDDLQRRARDGALSAREHFEKTSRIGLLMAYDLIDKLRYWEKETLELPEERITARLDHLVRSVEQLRAAYLVFSEPD